MKSWSGVLGSLLGAAGFAAAGWWLYPHFTSWVLFLLAAVNLALAVRKAVR